MAVIKDCWSSFDLAVDEEDKRANQDNQDQRNQLAQWFFTEDASQRDSTQECKVQESDERRT